MTSVGIWQCFSGLPLRKSATLTVPHLLPALADRCMIMCQEHTGSFFPHQCTLWRVETGMSTQEWTELMNLTLPMHSECVCVCVQSFSWKIQTQDFPTVSL
jgi:hypothetical protein